MTIDTTYFDADTDNIKPGRPALLDAIQRINSLSATVVTSIANLKLVDKTKFSRVTVLGYYAPGDRGGGIFYYDSADTTSVDNGGTIIVATDGGRWKLIYSTSLSVKQFGAKGDGVTDDTTKIQACITAAGLNGIIDVPRGTYVLSATLNALFGQWMRGASASWQGAIFKRTTDYGDTLVFGDSSPTGYCGPARVSDIFFQHSTMYSTGDASLANKATTGAHIRMYGGQGPQIENCWLWRMPYQIVFEGGSIIKVENSSLKGIWDHATVALQEGFAQIYLKKSTNHGYPVTVTINGCELNGANVNARSVGFTTADGSVNKNITELIGSQYGVFVDAAEDISLTNSYLGGFNINAVKFNIATGGAAIDVRIADNHFDGARDFQINFDSTSATLYALGVQIHGNTFNGEAVSKGAIIAQNNGGAGASLVNFTIADNTFFQNYGSTIVLFSANGGTITGNTLESWNTLEIATTDAQWVSAVYASNSYTKNILIADNVIGGGGNAFDQSTLNTFTYKGVVIDASCVNVSERINVYAGIRSGSNFRAGAAHLPNLVIPTSQANYQMLAKDDAWIRKFAATAATAVILPQYPMKGREVVIKDGQGDAATWVVVISTGDGTTIDGAASINITTNYGYMRFVFNGTQWNRIG